MPQFAYRYFQLNINTQEVKEVILSSPKTIPQFTFMLGKLNNEARIYGAIYFCTERSFIK